ncbi:hypothetical protein G210_3492 [Candida maltosa Xu316]|uniref:CST complex subunit Stn1 N-terminal domain-containing protein n=1 Tax=Candida maltosa (strain Xu316) TaxID=1245528 RepID=M3HG77_CANMX|nr:hypothetical protein G210_3492 [Candida maltosa Xu316]
MSEDRLFYPSIKIDWGPGENHICLRTNNREYYVPEVFSQSSTFDTIIPVFISDINASPNLYSIYKHTSELLSKIIMINNYPVNKVRIFGKIIGEKYKELTDRSVVYVTVDDCSGDGSQVVVRMEDNEYKMQGCELDMMNYGKLVEIEGTLFNKHSSEEPHKKPTRTIDMTKFVVLSKDSSSLHLEIELWKERLDFRERVLVEPWVFVPTPQRASRVIEYRFTEDELQRRKRREDLVLSSSSEILETEDVTEDSLLVHAKHKSIDQMPTPTEEPKSDSGSIIITEKEIEIIELSSSDDDDGDDTMVISESGDPIRVVTEQQVILEIIKYIITNNFGKIRLIEIYRDPEIKDLLSNLTSTQLSTLQSSFNSKNLSFEEYQSIIFHRIRHTLQKDMQLITTDNMQYVESKSLKKLYRSLLNILKQFEKTPNFERLLVMDYLDSLKQKNLLKGDISYKLINGIIEFIIDQELNDWDNWRYDTGSISWRYIR